MSPLKRAYLQLVALWHEARIFIASTHADTALRIVNESEHEMNRAAKWLMQRSRELKEAQVDYDRAVAALQRHDRHRELGIQ